MEVLDKDLEIEKNDLIWQLVSIEEDVQKIFTILKNDNDKENEEINKLLIQIEKLAIKSRKKIIHMMMDNTLEAESKNIVTDKEIRELLEDFI